VGEEDWQISAKTGTAERGDGTNNAWMVTFAPADDPQYVIVVNRLKTKEIGKSLAPVVEELYEYLAEQY
jgi:peptidoglycan glycosyltransferase